MIKAIKIKIKTYATHLHYLLKRHFINQASLKDYRKIIHYLKVGFRNKFFNYPRLVMIEIGTTCNLQCETCPTPREYLERPLILMNIDDFKKIIDNIKNYVHVVLLYVSNEPLLNPYLPEMIKYAAKNFLYVMISTNATLLDEKKSNELINAGLDEILLCLDGMTKESYELFRTGADFDVVIKNIRNFCFEKKKRKLKKPYVEVQFIVTKLNQDQIPEIKKFSREIGSDRLKIKSLSIAEYCYSDKKRQELVDKFLPTREDAKVRYKKDIDGKIKKRKIAHCNTVKNQIVTLVDGRLVLCCYDVRGEYVYGNLLEKQFKDIWFDQKNINKRKIAEKRQYALCKKCDLY